MLESEGVIVVVSDKMIAVENEEVSVIQSQEVDRWRARAVKSVRK